MVLLSASALFAKQAADSETGVARPVSHRFTRCHLERTGVGLELALGAAAKPKCLCAASYSRRFAMPKDNRIFRCGGDFSRLLF